MTQQNRASIYERITAEIITAMEKDAGEYRMPWHHDGSPAARPTNVATGVAYRGLNILALWAAAEHAGYSHGLWGTYRCWAKLGAQVRKGERATLAVFWKRTDGAENGDDEDSGRRPRMFARGFSLFNLTQVENFSAPEAPRLAESERIAHAEAFVAALKVPIVIGGDMAYYRPSTDTVHLPPFERFKDAVSAVGVNVHEICNIASVIGCDDETKGGRSAALRFSAMGLRRTESFPA